MEPKKKSDISEISRREQRKLHERREGTRDDISKGIYESLSDKRRIRFLKEEMHKKNHRKRHQDYEESE